MFFSKLASTLKKQILNILVEIAVLIAGYLSNYNLNHFFFSSEKHQSQFVSFIFI